MKKSTKIWLWVLTLFFTLSTLVYLPSFSSIFSLLLVCLVVPIPKWQAILQKFIRGKLKVAIVIVLALLTIFTAPTSDSDVMDNIPTSVTDEYTTVPTSESTTEITTEPATTPITEPTTAPTTEPTTAPTTEPTHTHEYSAATCTEPKTCSCGATEGKAAGHSWKSATCTEPKTCKTCAKTEGSALGHSWKAATCTAPKTCKTCKKTEGSKTDHNWTDATYSSPKKCSVCGKTEGNALEKPGEENYHGHVYTGGSSSTKYHYEANCAGKYSHEITWEDVDKLNLGPCKTCVLN